MRVIGIRELKAHLSRVLRDVQSGEAVLVTDRGRIVAELRAPGAESEGQSVAEQALRRLVRTGGLRVGEARVPNPYRKSPLRSPAGTARTLLAEERRER